MSNELESDRAMVVMGLLVWWRFRVTGADDVEVTVAPGRGYYCETETKSPT